MTLEVLVCTKGAGITRVSEVMAAPRDGVSYLVSFQYSGEEEYSLVPDSLRGRGDVRLVSFRDSGLSRNRNHALMYAKGDIVLFADDDNRYGWGDFDKILAAFGENDGVDAICFQSRLYEGGLHREFPAESFSLHSSPKGYYVRSCELVLRRRPRMPLFDTRFGLGSDFLACGEEEVFVSDLLKRDFKVIYYPADVVSTASGTTGERFLGSAAVRRSKGAVLASTHGFWGAALRVVKFAAVGVRGMSRPRALFDMLRGVVYAKRIGRC